MNAFESYIEEIVSRLPCSKRGKQDIRDELRDHLEALRSDIIMEEGVDEENASSMAIARFGAAERIAKELSESLPLIDSYIRKWIVGILSFYVLVAGYLMLLSSDRWSRRTFMINWKEKMMSYGYTKSTEAFQNLKPFHTLSDYLIHHDHYRATTMIYNLLGNVAVFMPLGLLLPLLFSSMQNAHRLVFIVFISSMGIECVQYIWSLGSFDVDDLMLNTLGGVVGYGVYRAFIALMQRYRLKLIR
ncbi:VanZ family protein [Paenibacillus sp. SYP-B3998]|uniref:VanZ family protein n=1 Tax=Paenibacillus sp. SYP-B3998 TaxID=2678564 RepID=A0A6G3ZWM4_9BACL|nr:VanZ family protein [Paenibacillus sp. SYP-B3998]NEW06532.1 VanZ family protein [Paenibacillus sp. SYP-B3998]